MWYLDDGTLVGPKDDVLLGWRIISEESAKVGLKLNLSKCELFSQSPDPLPDFPTEIKRVSDQGGFDLLGSPLGSADFASQYVGDRVEKIAKAASRLQVVNDPQNEKLLLRACIGMPKFSFALRSAPPSFLSLPIATFDELIEGAIRNRLGVPLSSLALSQSRWPLSLGGLGIYAASDVALPAYIGCAAESAALVAQLLRSPCRPSDMLLAADSFNHFSLSVTTPPDFPSDVDDLLHALSGDSDSSTSPDQKKKPCCQKFLSDLVHKSSIVKLCASPSLTIRDRLRLAAVTRPGVGSWLGVLPNWYLGLKFPKEEFSVLLKWWLGLPISPPGAGCPVSKCNKPMDVFGDHAVSCPCGPSRIARHDSLNRSWAHSVRAAGALRH